MSRFSRLFFVSLLFCAALPFSMAQAAPSGKLSEKIVFVRADPSVGVSSMRGITVADSGPGAIGKESNIATGGASQGAMVTNSHAAPDMQGRAAPNPKTSEIGIVNPDGSGVTLLHVFGLDPMLSPDGTKIVYCSQRETLYSQIYVMNSDGSNQKKLTETKGGDACGAAWSPDGKKIAYHAFELTQPSRNPEIWVMDADGSNQKKLTDHGLDPHWSPNGQQIVFASHRDGIFQIYVMKADGSGVTRLTKHNGEDSSPVFAPDGAAILYVSATADDHRGLFLMSADGSDQHDIGHSKKQDYCFPSWSRDGQTIAFSVLNRIGSQGIVTGEEKPRCEQWSGEYQIFAMGADGKVKMVTDAKVMGTHPSYGRIATP
jgi:dipeptidyl aminopeptidase/acylaminoacyl peptidase